MPISIPFKVAVRVRPLVNKEEGRKMCVSFVHNSPQIIIDNEYGYTYDYVCGLTQSQASVYDETVRPLIQHLFDDGQWEDFHHVRGYADFSIDPEAMGVIPRVVEEIFGKIKELEDSHLTTVNVSYLEIINEDLIDLFSTEKNSLAIREENGLIKIHGLKEQAVSDPMETMRYLEQGGAKRTTAATAMNNTSSRSHAIVTITIDNRHKEDTLKQQRVELVEQMKEDAEKWKTLKMQKEREFLQLQQKDRESQYEIEKLKQENQKLQDNLQRKSEEDRESQYDIEKLKQENQKLQDNLQRKSEEEEENEDLDLSKETSVQADVAEADEVDRYEEEVDPALVSLEVQADVAEADEVDRYEEEVDPALVSLEKLNEYLNQPIKEGRQSRFVGKFRVLPLSQVSKLTLIRRCLDKKYIYMCYCGQVYNNASSAVTHIQRKKCPCGSFMPPL